ncbi:MAG: C40 family peptidase [Acidobacteria bacterium]|nr:C40 family peptidase [Acidobacteriota bacterium]
MGVYKGSIAALAFFVVAIVCFTVEAAAQDRPRVIKSVSSRPINQPPTETTPEQQSQPTQGNTNRQPQTLTNKIVVVPEASLVKKTGESSPLTAMNKAAARRTVYGSSVSNNILLGIQSRLGIPYKYGSSGPNRYDCSGFVWSVFKDAGLEFERTSARSLWEMSTPVEGADKYVFGTLVFMNKLGHMGIVADENGFYHASSSKGITYSPFKGYWEKRIVGFRRLDLQVKITDPVAPAKTK